jgi:hypothetical protein
MSSLDSRHYVATPADIASIAKAYSSAISAGQGARGAYLRALIATTQHELGAKPRLRTSHGDPLNKESIAAQLKALETVHARFYEVVLDNVEGTADERNSRSNFARSAVSTVRAYVRAGNDLTLLAAARASKSALAAASPAPKRSKVVSVPVLRNRADKAVQALATLGDTLAKVDKAQAVEVLEQALSKITARLMAYGVAKPIKNAKDAIEQGVPFKGPHGGMFFPVDRSLS